MDDASTPSPVGELSPNLFMVRDTCNVYLVCNGRSAVAIDFGSGLVLDHLDELGIDSISDVLLTHHHRDQAQGLPRAVAAGIRIWVPPVERDLFEHADEHWQARDTWTRSYQVQPFSPPTVKLWATRIGLVGKTTANGHVVQEGDRFVALPSKRALNLYDGYDYQVRLSYKGRTTTAPEHVAHAAAVGAGGTPRARVPDPDGGDLPSATGEWPSCRCGEGR